MTELCHWSMQALHTACCVHQIKPIIAFFWFTMPTAPARVCRWDYGYQTTAMANRTVLVDNNTWNNTHIATVGRAMASPEKQAWEIYRALDVTHVLVIFGGFIG